MVCATASVQLGSRGSACAEASSSGGAVVSSFAEDRLQAAEQAAGAVLPCTNPGHVVGVGLVAAFVRKQSWAAQLREAT